ncbi:Glutaminyl-peptide cyclotransferase [Handroanthus impetiginosus]|uniref:Glutaminyl-peptide cyclotransferase n=1 Tax=Handroanthus impetiginosus TaxID=429701 RepID=A0A2G9HHS4_9LAMI|nr:Glutaminyl-peptide cyclotransferase [Handroanthus impetiginosus]
MAPKSLRKKSSKRSSNSKPPSSHDNSMALSAPSFYSNYRIVPLLISAVMFVFVLITLTISSKMSNVIGSDPNIDRIYSIEVVNEFPHDPSAFTQGLLYAENDTLFESTGLNGHSSVRRVALGTGKVEAIHRMSWSYFGEGLTLLGDRLRCSILKCKTVGDWQLTGKFYLEVMELRPCITWTLRHSKLSRSI